MYFRIFLFKQRRIGRLKWFNGLLKTIIDIYNVINKFLNLTRANVYKVLRLCASNSNDYISKKLKDNIQIKTKYTLPKHDSYIFWISNGSTFLPM